MFLEGFRNYKDDSEMCPSAFAVLEDGRAETGWSSGKLRHSYVSQQRHSDCSRLFLIQVVEESRYCQFQLCITSYQKRL